MKYKDLLVGDWFAYNGKVYIKSQKYTDPKFINVSLDGESVSTIGDNVDVEFQSCFFAKETTPYKGTLTFAPLGRLVQNEKCVYMRVALPDHDGIDTVIIYSSYNNAGRWFNSYACSYEVESFTKKLEYWER